MISELSQTRFSLIPPLLPSPLLGVEVKAIAAGNNPGRVFVDSTENPRSALVFSPGIEGFYLLGDPRNAPFIDALNPFINATVAPLLRDHGLDWFEVSGCAKEWNATIETAFARRQPNLSTQFIYRLPDSSARHAAPVSRDPSVLSVDADLFSRPLDDLGFVRAKIDLFWSSLADFLAAGIGFCSIHQNRIASLCMSGFVADRTHVIDIETAEAFRRCGHGYRAGRAFIDECLARGLTPHWDCMQENAPSASMAENLGLIRVAEYSLYGFSIHPPCPS